VARGARRAGRDPRDVGIVVGAVTVVHEDRAVAEALARREVAMYLPVVMGLDPTLDVEESEVAAVEAAVARDDVEAAATALSRPVLQKLARYGMPADVIAQIEAFAAAGVSRVEFGTPHGPDEAAAIRLLGERVLPHFEAQEGGDR
jgi:5,10-methylenetetrahydromethanopterin reductase